MKRIIPLHQPLCKQAVRIDVKGYLRRAILCISAVLLTSIAHVSSATPGESPENTRMESTVGTTPLSIFVSILPQKFLVERIGQQLVRVSTMVGPGHSPATYEPTPKQISQLSTCDAYLRVGVPFEKSWISKISSANPRLKIFYLTAEQDEQHAHRHKNELDPHAWTSPREVKQLAQKITSILMQLDSHNSELYANNLKVLEGELNTLDRFIRQTIHEKNITHFMVYHPAWGHFAAQYGLTQIAIEKDGKEPGSKALTELIEAAKKQHIQRIFVQPQFNHRSAQIIADAIHAEIVVADPLAENLIENIKDFTNKLTQGT